MAKEKTTKLQHKEKRTAFAMSATIIMAIYSFTLIFPLLWAILSSLKGANDFVLRPFELPTRWRWEHYVDAFTKLSASLLVKGTLVLDSGAKFAGIVLGDSNDANASDTVKSTIIIKSGAATTCTAIKECANGKYGMECRDNTWDEYTVKDMNWTGRWQTAPETYGQIPETPGTYTYNGGTWS